MNRLENKAEKAEKKLKEIWIKRGLDPNDIYVRDNSGDYYLSEEAQDLFNKLYRG